MQSRSKMIFRRFFMNMNEAARQLPPKHNRLPQIVPYFTGFNRYYCILLRV
jgi:hypothetical protein